MSLPEFVGFIITILVLLFISMRRIRDERFRRENPEEYAEKQRRDEEAFKAFIKSLQGEDDELDLRRRPAPQAHRPLKSPPPPPLETKRRTVKPAERFALHSNLEDYETHSKIEDRHVETHIQKFQQPELLSEDLMWTKGGVADAGRVEGDSKARELVSNLSDYKKMVVLHEIFGPPKGMQ